MTTSMTGYSSQYKTPKGYNAYSQPTMDPTTAGLHEQMTKQIGTGASTGLDWLNKVAGGSDEAFKDLEAPAFRQFEGSMGQLGSRFSGMGTGGTKSSGFRLAAGGMASDLAQDLQSKRMAMQSDAVKQLMGMSTNLMQTPTAQYGLSKKAPTFLETFLPELARTVTSAGVDIGTTWAKNKIGGTSSSGGKDGGGGKGGQAEGGGTDWLAWAAKIAPIIISMI